MEEDITLPSNIEEIAALVLSFYDPIKPAAVVRNQTVLHHLQKSPQGWSIAHQLLDMRDPKLKFFGALTIIVKLNTASLPLSTEDALELLRALIGWLVGCLEDGSGALVVRKLSSALATFFLHYHRLWNPCARHVIHCLATQQFSPPQDFHHVERSTADLPADFHALSRTKMLAALWFFETIADDAARIDMNSPLHSGIYQSIVSNVADVSALILHALSASPAIEGDSSWVEIKSAAIKCYQSWVLLIQRVSARDERLVGELRPLVGPLIEAMTTNELFEAAVEVMIDILSNYSDFLTQDHCATLHSLLESPWSRERYRRLVVDGDFDFDSTQFGHLLLAFGDAKMDALMQDNSGRSNDILSSICGLLGAPEPPVADNKIFVPAVEFWSSFIEVMTDTVYSEDASNRDWARKSMDLVFRAISLSWEKIIYPPPDIFNSWDSADRVGFMDARKDVADLLQASFTLLGPRLVSMFVDAMLKCLGEASWAHLEAVAFCLGALADCLCGDGDNDALLEPVFSPMLFNAIAPSHKAMPSRTRQTCSSLIEKYAEYFERHPSVLPHALNLLFTILGDPQMAPTASKSIHSLCCSCRAHLGTEVGAFMHQYEGLASAQVLDCSTSERIIGAVAAVLQSLDREEERASGLRCLLGFVNDDVRRSCEMAAAPGAAQGTQPCIKADRCALGGPGIDPALHVALRGLRCLVSMGKGLQAPIDGPVDLESEGGFASLSPQKDSTMWQLQETVMAMVMQIRETFPSSGEVVETICNMLRTGFSETGPGLFVLEPEKVCNYLTSHGLGVPRIGGVVSTACSFICSLSTRASTAGSLEGIRANMLSWVISILQQLPKPDSDTEVSQNGIEFVNRVVGKYPDMLITALSPNLVEFFFMFTLRVLEGNEPLPKAAAADFWVTFLTLKSNKPDLQGSLNRMMTAVGPLLTQSIIRNVGGKAARSELDKLTEPLKRLASHHAGARAWLEAALGDASFPGTHVSDHDKSLFVKRILCLRGGRTTNQVVRDFWLACRGASFAYTS